MKNDINGLKPLSESLRDIHRRYEPGDNAEAFAAGLVLQVLCDAIDEPGGSVRLLSGPIKDWIATKLPPATTEPRQTLNGMVRDKGRVLSLLDLMQLFRGVDTEAVLNFVEVGEPKRR